MHTVYTLPKTLYRFEYYFQYSFSSTLVKKSRNAYHEKIHKCKKKNITEPVNQGSVVTFKFKLDQKVY